MKITLSRKEFEGRGKNIVSRQGPKQILILEVEGRIFALDNRCPHEGYPLGQGAINPQTCVLTCKWHNWKFDLKTGQSLIGADNVRTYPVSIDNENIIVDLTDPTSEVIGKRILKDFETAFKKRQYGRMAREIARLMFNKLDPLSAVENAILWSYEKLEFGTTHAYAAAADWVSLYNDCSQREDKIICLNEAVDHIALDSLRHKDYPFYSLDEEYSEATISPLNKLMGARTFVEEYSEKTILAAIEHEDVKRAEVQVLSGFNKGLRFQHFEETLVKAALAHYNDFGHSLIYAVKSAQLSRFFDNPHVDKALVLSLVRNIVYATREDLLPEFKKYKKTLLALKTSSFGEGIEDTAAMEAVNVSDTYKWLCDHKGTYTPKTLYKILLRSNAENFLYFNIGHQDRVHCPVGDNMDWLDFTHALTFANAVRITCEKFPKLWDKGLLQMASFYGRNRPYIDETVNKEEWIPISQSDFKSHVKKTILDHGIHPPVFSAHILKTSLAVLEEAEVKELSKMTREILYAGLNRFMNSPIKQKHIRRMAYQAIALVSKDFT